MKSDGTGFTYLRQMAGFSDGSAPNGGVVVNSNGLFGACYLGGASSVGTTFSISKVGTNFQLLHPFVTTGSDGRDPAGLLLLASNNSFYGTTYFGGGAAAGSIFQLSPNGIIPYSIIFRFTNSISGANPSAKLLEGADGLLYGSAETNGPGGQGVLFSLAKSGAGFQLLHSFSSTTNSLRKPQGALIQGSNGFLYGTTSAGGADGFGGVFKLNTNGSGYQVLHEFSASGGDCRAPVAGVTFGPDGMLYGVTQFGGGSINGSLFRLNTDGTGYQKLFAFTGLSGAGANPVGALIRAPDGTLYGTTSFGGDFNMGTIFSVSFPAPLLSINNLGPAGIQLRWPTNSTGFHLVSNTNLSNASGWQLVNATTVTTNGNFQVGLSATGSASFFRLVQP
jgi:uncharacterized repeat protein (TIGR03803 family)